MRQFPNLNSNCNYHRLKGQRNEFGNSLNSVNEYYLQSMRDMQSKWRMNNWIVIDWPSINCFFFHSFFLLLVYCYWLFFNFSKVWVKHIQPNCFFLLATKFNCACKNGVTKDEITINLRNYLNFNVIPWRYEKV